MTDNIAFPALQGKRVFVIGGTGVLGGAIARAFAGSGCRVAISGRSIEKARKVCESTGFRDQKVLPLAVDALSKESLQEARRAVESEFGGLDILVNAAGGNKPEATVMPESDFFNMPIEAMRQVLDLNLVAGGVLPAQVFGELMRKQEGKGSIIMISSMAAFRPLTRVVAYSAAKAALDSLTRWLSVEFARKYGEKIRVNSVAPGFVLTEQNRFLLTDKDTGQLSQRGKTIIDHTPMGRFGEPDEVAGACLWLASDFAKFVTGAVIPVDGGFSAFSGV